MTLADTNGRTLQPNTCFEDLVADGVNTIVVTPMWDIQVDEHGPVAASKRRI
jgi:hypothetical protein